MTELVEKYKQECYDCLLSQYGCLIQDQKIYDEWMQGITCYMGVCSVCNKESSIVPLSDIENGIKASQGKRISILKWD